MGIGITRASWQATSSSPAQKRRHLLTTVLKGVSRAFYLSVRVLPSRMREPVAIAYLLARVADTITDTSSMPANERMVHLRKFRQIIAGDASSESILELSTALAHLQPLTGERVLLAELPGVFALVKEIDEADAKAVRSVVLTLTRGMLFDLKEFSSDDTDSGKALDSIERLDEYCYLIAGCVGEFWTKLSMAHTPSMAQLDEREMNLLGVRFGLALQMTNILRDMPKDLRMGRCYLPKGELKKAELRPDDLLDAVNADRAHPMLIWGIRRTLDHFSAAEQYIAAIPRRNLRLRLAALWPLLIGLKTLAKLARSKDWLNPETPIRIPRRAVYGIIALSLLCGRSNALTRLWIRRIRRDVERAIQT